MRRKQLLLCTIRTATSSNHLKLKVLATVLSKFEEMMLLSEGISNEYSERSIK